MSTKKQKRKENQRQKQKQRQTEQVKQVERVYRVYAAKSGDTSGQYYLMDHTSFIYLMDQDGHYRSVVRPDTSPEALAESVRKLLHS